MLLAAASIEDGCLAVGGHVVIWHESRLPDAEAAVQSLRAGNEVMLDVGGSGVANAAFVASLGLPEPCATKRIWFGSPAD